MMNRSSNGGFLKYVAKLILGNIRKTRRYYLGFTNPEKLAREIHSHNLNRPLDLDDPKDLNEKINWLKFRSNTASWTQLADKYLVRDYVKTVGLGHILVECYGVWDKIFEIDFQKLPNRFVLKSNNACGTVMLVPDKSTLDYDITRKTLSHWLSRKYYGVDSAVLHYYKISPLILAEELLEEASENKIFSRSLIDYKVWCFHGKPYCILVCYDRTASSLHLDLYDTKWQPLSHHLVTGVHYHVGTLPIPKPHRFDQMLAYASMLSAGFPQVRVDFYSVKTKLYFSELTFTAAAGYMNYFSHEFLLELGSQVDLPVINN